VDISCLSPPFFDILSKINQKGFIETFGELLVE
jgi:hypothetical protein